MLNLICLRCSIAYTVPAPINRGKGMCHPCNLAHIAEKDKACSRVCAAKKQGRIQKAAGQTCVDCGAPACDLDHRDYTKPLEVVPVCRSCNRKRGPAFDSVYRPTEKPAVDLWAPVTTMAQLAQMGDEAVIAGYRAALNRSPDYTRREKAYWHGYMNGQVDRGDAPISNEQCELARAYVAHQRAH